LTKPSNLLEVKAELAELLHQKAVLEARDRFYIFVKMLAPLMLNGNDYRDGRHIAELASMLQDVECDDISRLMVSLPPGSMKSVLLMMFSAWCFGRRPHWRVMWISHTAMKAEECSAQVRDLIRTDEYREIFPNVKIREDQSGVTHWKLTAGGSFRPAGAGAQIAGYRFNLGIIDDPMSEQTTTVERDKINAWYHKGFLSRKLSNDNRVVLVMTRWHVRDLIGYLIDKAERTRKGEQWEIISVPAILDESSAEWLKLPVGGSYWPEFVTMEDLETIQADFPPGDWASLYLQSPSGESGNIFKKEDFQDWTKEDAPVCEEVIQVMDTAFSRKETADFSVIQMWGIFMKKEVAGDGNELEVPHAILLHMRRGRWTYPELRRISLDEYKKWKPDRVVIENKASGQSLIQDLKVNGLPILPFQPDRDKVTRAHATTGIVERHRVHMPFRKKYAADLLKEALEFPKGAHDDAVDTMVMALLYLRRRYELSKEAERRPQRNQLVNRGYWEGARNGR
jgi:predicted phage terminase large subunit-like protein